MRSGPVEPNLTPNSPSPPLHVRKNTQADFTANPRSTTAATASPACRFVFGFFCHWNDFKILLVFKSLNGLAPPYISDMISFYDPTRCLRSSSKRLLTTPRINTDAAHGGSSYCAPILWNIYSLPLELRSLQSMFSFKKGLKTYFS